MTSFLRLNGIIVPVAPGSFSVIQEDIGASKRASDGTPLFNRRTTKRTWGGRTRPGTAAEALAFRDLVTGKGNVLNFEDSSLYTSQGLAPSAVGANAGIDGTNAKYGTKRLLSAGATDNKVTWPMFTASSPWTVALWVSTSDFLPWVHYVVDSSARKWVDGTRNDAATTTFLAVSSGAVTLGITSTALAFDDVVAVPQLFPTTWPAQISGFGSAFGALPRLTADGLAIEQNATITVKGICGELRLIKAASAANLHDFSFQLSEV